MQMPLATTAAAALVPRRPTTVDVHHHVIPRFFVDELRALGSRSTLPGVDPPAWSVEASLAMMDRHGLRAAVVNVWPGVAGLDRASARSLARRVNEFLAELVASRPDRFGAFAVLPLPHVEDSLAELTHSLDVLGLDGVGVLTNHAGTYLGDPSLDRLHGALAERRTPIFVHPAPPPTTGQPSFDLPLSLYEFPFETVRLSAQLLYNRTLERHPGLRIILSHGGGGISYYAGRLLCGPLITAALGERLPETPMSTLRSLYCDTAMIGDRFAFASVRQVVSPDRILVGSDFPFMPESYVTANDAYVRDQGGLSRQEQDQVDHVNALALFPRFS